MGFRFRRSVRILPGVRLNSGERVAGMVAGCTDTPEDYTGGPKAPWQTRKETYLHPLRAAPPGARVSLADKLHNARSILGDYRVVGEDLWGRFSVPRERTLWYYRSLVDAFRAAGQDGPMLHELDRVVTEIETLVRSSSARNR